MNDGLVNVESEVALLSALWVDPRVIDRAADKLSGADFGMPLFGRLFDETVRLHSEGVRAPVVQLANLFRDDADLQELGGPSWLYRQTESSAALIGLDDFMETLADLSNRRALRASLDRASNELAQSGTAAAVDIADAALWEATRGKAAVATLTSAEMMSETLARIDMARNHRSAVGAMVPNLPEINRLTGGLEKGQFIVLAGRPGMGKTAVSCAIATGVAATGRGVLFVSLEMRPDALGMRMVADHCFGLNGAIAHERIKNGDLSNAEMERVVGASEEISQLPLIVTKAGRVTLGKLSMLIRRYKRYLASRGQSLDLVIVDYLQKMQADKPGGRYEIVTDLSLGLSAMAGENDVAMLVLSQLSRNVEQREDKRPMLSDLRESGQIEQDADTVLFLYRAEYYLNKCEPDQSKDPAAHAAWRIELDKARDKIQYICAKRRDGEEGSDWGYFFPVYQALRSREFYKQQAVAA